MIARDYAKAVYELGSKAEHLRALKAVLERRGHLRLLPQIFAEYKKLILHDDRLSAHRSVTPEAERTKHLLELYRKLTA